MKVSFMKHRPKILPYSAARWIGKTPNRFCKFTSAPFSSKIFATFTAPVCKEVRNSIKNIFWELEMAIFTIQRGHVKRTFAVFIFCINVSSVCDQQFCNVRCVYSWIKTTYQWMRFLQLEIDWNHLFELTNEVANFHIDPLNLRQRDYQSTALQHFHNLINSIKKSFRLIASNVIVPCENNLIEKHSVTYF